MLNKTARESTTPKQKPQSLQYRRRHFDRENILAVVTNSDLHVLGGSENEGSRTWSVVVVKRRGHDASAESGNKTLVVTSVRRKATKGVTEVGNHHDLK